MINRVVLTGRLTKEPELKYTPTGIAFCRFTLAVNRSFQKEGQQQADFINILVWRKAAENVANFLHKGSLCGIDGRIQTGSFEGQDGKRVYTFEVVADGVQFFSKNENNNRQQNTPRDPQNTPRDPQNVSRYGDNTPAFNENDLPF